MSQRELIFHCIYKDKRNTRSQRELNFRCIYIKSSGMGTNIRRLLRDTQHVAFSVIIFLWQIMTGQTHASSVIDISLEMFREIDLGKLS